MTLRLLTTSIRSTATMLGSPCAPAPAHSAPNGPLAIATAFAHGASPMGILSAADDVALRVVPTITSTPHPDAVDQTAIGACSGSYVCDCLVCQADRAHRVKMGVRGSIAVPHKRAA